MLVTMRLHISLEHLRATIATYQNVGMRLSESIALRLCRHSNLHDLKMTPVYLFLLKKEQEGKQYNVAKMAGVNKFLRIYYARAMETLKQQ